MENSLEKMLREALDAEPPAGADARIRALIRFAAESRRRKRRVRVLAAAAALALLLGGGLWQLGRHRAVPPQEAAEQREVAAAQADEAVSEEEIVLEIIDMAEPVEFAAFQVAQM